MVRSGEWTDEEVHQIEKYMRSETKARARFPTFVEDDEWEVLSVERRTDSKSIVDLEISRIVDGRRVTFELVADDRGEEWGNESKLTDQVFWLTIILMEYVDIFGIEDLDNNSTVRLIPRRSVYDFRPPGSVEPVRSPNVTYELRSPFYGTHSTTPEDLRVVEEREVIAMIRETLQQLVGLQVRSLGHQVGMLMIGFGGTTRRQMALGPRKGETREESDFHLHVSARWQVLQNDRVTIDDHAEDLYDVDGRPTRESRALLESLIGVGARTLESVSTSDKGNIDFNLTDGVSIHISRGSLAGEEWRLWATDSDTSHFVIEIADDGPREGSLSVLGSPPD
jgi:hypothetical protein